MHNIFSSAKFTLGDVGSIDARLIFCFGIDTIDTIDSIDDRLDTSLDGSEDGSNGAGLILFFLFYYNSFSPVLFCE